MRQPRLRVLVLAMVATVLLAGRPAAASDNVALRWNEVLLQAVRNTRLAPMFTARALAVVHTAMYDAWSAYDETAVGTRLGGTLRRPAAERTPANREKAVSYAAYRALVDLLPTQRGPLFDPLMAALGLDPADASTDPATPAGVGNAAAAAVLAFRHHDGSNQLGDLNPGAYSDYTGYQPVNDPDLVIDPNHWQPLRNQSGTTQVFLAPHWGRVTPFALHPAEEFRPDPPPQLPHGSYRREAIDLLHLSARLGDREKTVAAYWADGPATETPPGHWSLFAQWVSRRDGHTLDQDVKMFFALGNAVLDASVAVWECKRFYDLARPVTAIRYLYAGKPVRAWAGPFRGTQVIAGEQFQSYIATPPFAEYVSGHSTFSAAAAGILKAVTGSDAFGLSVTFPAGSSPVEPGQVPAEPLALSWPTFSAAADEAGLSRRYGGIHFESGDLQARVLGRKIGAAVWSKATSYFEGRPLP
jgi:hypothetical protein